MKLGGCGDAGEMKMKKAVEVTRKNSAEACA